MFTSMSYFVRNNNLAVFRSRLKSHLFERSFPADSYWHLPLVLAPDSRLAVFNHRRL